MSALVQRNGNGQFKAGTASANPGGRPHQLSEIRDLARQHTSFVITRLVQLAKSSNEFVSLSALQQLADRGWGKPQTSSTLDIGVGIISAERAAEVKMIMEELRGARFERASNPLLIEGETDGD